MRVGFTGMPNVPLSKLALGEAVRYTREREGMTQEDLAAEADVHPTWISDVETGKKDLRWSSLGKIAAGLDVTVLELVALAGRTELD